MPFIKKESSKKFWFWYEFHNGFSFRFGYLRKWALGVTFDWIPNEKESFSE